MFKFHTLQLVINYEILSDYIIENILSNLKRTVNHFKHSPLTCKNHKAFRKQ